MHWPIYADLVNWRIYAALVCVCVCGGGGKFIIASDIPYTLVTRNNILWTKLLGVMKTFYCGISHLAARVPVYPIQHI